MNAAHVHLLLNHFPTVGFGIGLALFVVALLRRDADLERAGLVVFFLIAALTIATYVSGNDAQEALTDRPEISEALMKAHEDAALTAFAFMQATGFFSWLGLWKAGRASRIPRWNLGVILILVVVTLGLMARAANMGGLIRHPEIRDAETAAVDASTLTLTRSWSEFVENSLWLWPASETVHFIGLSLLFGVVLILNLRMLGVGKGALSFAALHQLLPLGMLGFVLNLITGMMFFVATPRQYTGFLFFLKIVLVTAGALNILYFMLCKVPWKIGDSDDAPTDAKVIAISGIVIWLTVLFCGHMLPWFGNSF